VRSSSTRWTTVSDGVGGEPAARLGGIPSP